MTKEQVKNYSDLLKFIEQSIPNKDVMEIAPLLDISWGTYNKIKRGLPVRDTTLRKVRAFAKDQLGMEVKEISGTTIQIIQTQNVNTGGGSYALQKGGDSVKELQQKVGELIMELSNRDKRITELEAKLKHAGTKNKT